MAVTAVKHRELWLGAIILFARDADMHFISSIVLCTNYIQEFLKKTYPKSTDKTANLLSLFLSL
jgi:hypothetical protein